MWETIKSVAFVLFTVMVALILQARADRSEFDGEAMSEAAAEQMQVLPALSVDLE